MIGATFCSGIGAPELAAPWVDWRFASEVAPFPRNVLQQRFGYVVPEDHNQGAPLLWGDMSEVTPELMRARGIPLPELIVAGTPCQAFSVAGARKGLADKRGNLTLTFVEILHAIVAARPDGKLAVLWENVPGVLSDEGNAFGCFLGGLVGAVDALAAPADGSWPSEGMVEGPRARAAWAVLDAQWFGVAQRRRRVFVVVDFGNCVDPAAVLLEPDSLRGNTPPRREAWSAVAALTANGVGTCGPDDNQGQAGHLIPAAFGGNNNHSPGRYDFETETFIAHPVAFDCKGTQVQFSTDGTHPTLRSMGHAAIAQGWAVRRLIPSECNKLQGFPPDHTAITVRGKPAADGPQYKAIGNSMARPVVAWILERMRISMEAAA